MIYFTAKHAADGRCISQGELKFMGDGTLGARDAMESAVRAALTKTGIRPGHIRRVVVDHDSALQCHHAVAVITGNQYAATY